MKIVPRWSTGKGSFAICYDILIVIRMFWFFRYLCRCVGNNVMWARISRVGHIKKHNLVFFYRRSRIGKFLDTTGKRRPRRLAWVFLSYLRLWRAWGCTRDTAPFYCVHMNHGRKLYSKWIERTQIYRYGTKASF